MKKTRKFPPIDRHSIGPPEDESILNFYNGIFDTVFVALNPFLQILDSSQFTVHSFWDIEGTDTYKQRILSHSKPITWQEILNKTKLNNINDLDIGLRTSILGLKEESQNMDFQEAIARILEPNQLMEPSEGRIPVHMMNFILKALKKLDYDWVCAGSEFGDSMELIWIDDIQQHERDVSMWPNIYTYDRKVLISCHWDSFQTYVCGSEELVRQIVKHARLEGFYANRNTEVYWSLRSDQFG